jgi:acetyl esterase/lipase
LVERREKAILSSIIQRLVISSCDQLGENEILRGDAVRVAELARAAGVDVRMEVYLRMWHVWQLTLAMRQPIQSLEDIAGFHKARLEQQTGGRPFNCYCLGCQ